MVTPAGYISEPINALRRAVAGSTTFQLAVGAANISEALAKVIFQYWSVDALPGTEHHLTRPFAIVDFPKLRLAVIDGHCLVSSNSQLSIYFTMDHPTGDSHEDGYITFANFAGQSLIEALDQGGFENIIPVLDVETIVPPRRVGRNDTTSTYDFWEAAYAVTLAG